MKSSASASAPGKVILLGEHSVVYGEPAIAAAIDRRLSVTVLRDQGAAQREGEPPGEPLPGSAGASPSHAAGASPSRTAGASPSRRDAKCNAAIACAARAFDLDPTRLVVEVSSDIPAACGLGSSAALSLALVRALAELAETGLSNAEALQRAGEVEDVFHGTASGVDVAASASGRVIWFERGAPSRVEPVALGRPFELVVGLSGEERSTAGPVSRLRVRHERRPELYGSFFHLAGDLVRAGREALTHGDFETLGSLMDAAQGLLNAFGVSTPTLERMVWIARGAGALGAKLSGAGGGGAIVALAPGSSAAVAAALAKEGYLAFVTTIPAFAGEEALHARSNRRSA